MLEKALAKVIGSYEAIEGGKPYQAFFFLTGFPSDVIYHDSIESGDLWENIIQGAKANMPMVASVNSTQMGLRKEIKDAGLADHHAYTLLDTKIVIKDGKKHRLVLIRNPYGTRSKREWEGKWSDSSAELTNEMQE